MGTDYSEAAERIRAGRQMLLRIELYVARQWGAALYAKHEGGIPGDVPFGECSWFAAMQTVRQLRRGGSIDGGKRYGRN